MNITPSSISLTLSLLSSSYLSYRCITPPNPPPTTPHKTDRLDSIASLHSTNKNRIILLILGTIWALHISVILFPSSTSKICKHPDLLNPSLFQWSTRSVLYLLAVWGLGWMRLKSYSGLGKEFTFTLAVPKKLVTSGVYSWVQHPSYVGLIGLRIADSFFVQRLDGVTACFLPRRLIEVPYISEGLGVLLTVALCGALSMRILDEEEMLRGEFGEEWEKWHKKTARLIPGVF